MELAGLVQRIASCMGMFTHRLELCTGLPASFLSHRPRPSAKGGLEQALGSCDCLSPPLRWIRIPLELLPPPMPRSSAAATRRITNHPTTTSFPRPAPGKAEHHATRSSASNLLHSPGASGGHQEEAKQEDVSRGVTAAPEGSGKAKRANPNRGKRGREAVEPGANVLGKCKLPNKRGGGVGTFGTARFEQGCEEKGDFGVTGTRGARPPDEAATEQGMRAVKNARLQHQREMLDLWWLTGGAFAFQSLNTPIYESERQKLQFSVDKAVGFYPGMTWEVVLQKNTLGYIGGIEMTVNVRV